MTKVVSMRMPGVLERVIRTHAADSKKPPSDIVRSILMYALNGQFNFSALPDFQQFLDAKFDVRLPEDIVARLRAEALRLGVSISVYSRVVLYAYYKKRLVVVDLGECYALAENHDQKKSA
jgi:hypothetical protein